jgi:membrane protein YqaA with SNARE-associated domain
LKALLAHLLHEWHFVILPALAKLGIWASFVVALLDSSSLPVPIDAFLAVYIWADKHHFWFYPVLAAAGSAVGGLVPYWIGRGGGELFLLNRINRRRFDELRLRFERQEFFAVMIPSMLPPPTPWKVFVFAAGVFEMRVIPFMIAVFFGRLVRWMTLSILVLKLGPGAVDLISHHAVAAAVFVILIVFVGVAAWWWRKRRISMQLKNETARPEGRANVHSAN